MRRLVERGEVPHVLVRQTSNLAELAGLNVVRKIGDVTDPASLAAACREVDVVYHLAGLSATPAPSAR